MNTVLILDVETEELHGPYEHEFLPSVLHKITERAVMIIEKRFELDLAETTEAFDSILSQDFRIIDHPYARRNGIPSRRASDIQTPIDRLSSRGRNPNLFR